MLVKRKEDKMKKTIALLSALILALSLAACNTKSDVDNAYQLGYEKGSNDGYEEAKKEWVGYYSQIAYVKGYSAGIEDAFSNINAPYSSFNDFNESDEATVYDDPLAEVEREIRKAYQSGYNDGLNKVGVSNETKYVEVPKFYSEDQEEMYDEIWDEIYEQAREDAYEQAREDIECEFDIDLDY